MSEKWHSFALVGSMFCAILAGCGSEDSSSSEPKIPEARSSLARLAADAPAELVQTLCANNASFALDLLHAAKPDGNFFYSPQLAPQLFIQKVIHEAFVNVNEAGTEAAAATAVSMGKIGAPQTAKLELTRPFLFLIRDKATGSVVFLGRVVDPSAS